MRDYVFDCDHCSKKYNAPIKLIVPYGEMNQKWEVVIKFLRKHYWCGISEEYKKLFK